MSVWTSRESGKVGIQGQFIGTDGAKGTSFLIADADAATSPKIARAGSGFLVVYYTTNEISGAIVDSAGHVGPVIPICTAENTQSYPEIIAGGSNLLVVWQDARTYGSTGWDIYGRLISSSGIFIGNDFRIGPVQATQSFPIGSFNGENYVVIWTQEAIVNSAEKDFYGARVSQAGTVFDPDGFAVCTASGTQTTLNADCTAGPNGATALAWTDARTGLTSLYWTTVSREGAVLDGPPSSGRLVFQDISYPPGYPSITYNGREYVIFFASKSRVITSLVGTDGTVRPLQRVPLSLRGQSGQDCMRIRRDELPRLVGDVRLRPDLRAAGDRREPGADRRGGPGWHLRGDTGDWRPGRQPQHGPGRRPPPLV